MTKRLKDSKAINLTVIKFVTFKKSFYLCCQYEQHKVCNGRTYPDHFGQEPRRMAEL